MRKRQEKKNKKKAKQLLPISPYDQEIKADKKKWLEQVEKIVETENLKSSPPKVMIFKKQKRKQIQKKKKAKIRQSSTVPQPVVQKPFVVNPDDFPTIGKSKKA